MTESANASLSARRAVEALRAGVPSRDAVELLGFEADELLGAFDTRLTELRSSVDEDRQPRGILLAGEFGAGKSHALEYLAHRALKGSVAVSKVVVSKETQLFDPAKVMRAAIESLQVPGRTGDALAEIALNKLDPRSQQVAELFLWLSGSPLNSRFAATVWLYQNGGINPELHNRLVTFWSGGPLAVGQLRSDLRALGQTGTFKLESIAAKDLARQRFQFIARLLHAAGYNGWLILIDELELIGRYSVLQRGRSYAELARLLGLVDDDHAAGLTVVGGITPDFSSAVIRGKDDLNQIDFKFRSRPGDGPLTANLAERAMEEIERSLHRLPEPDQGRLRRTHANLVEVYATAYGSYAADDAELTLRPGWQMREYVRGWITASDLHRLDPSYHSDLVVDRIVTEYTEDELLESPIEADEDNGTAESKA